MAESVNNDFCLAPWTHTYLSPQSERRMCCASREPAQNFKQYIDTNQGTNSYKPLTLEEHWNSDHMKDVRKRMLAGETLPECEVCNYKLLNANVYRDYFNTMFAHKRESVKLLTDEDGTFHGQPVSFDYRLKNTCTFKCRMCGPMLSSAWEAEERKFNPNFEDENAWAAKPVRKQIRTFQEGQASKELWDAVREGRVEEIYWVGGEPLDWPEHWDIMRYLVDNDLAKNVFVRYNTNLSKVIDNPSSSSRTYLPILLKEFRGWQICASIDSFDPGASEYIRTGLDLAAWKQDLRYMNMHMGNKAMSNNFKFDLTLTLPGINDLRSLIDLAISMKIDILAKVVFSFSSDIFMSPLVLPRSLLEKVVNRALMDIESTALIYQSTDINTERDPLPNLRATLENLLTRKTFEEEYGSEEYLFGLWKGKARIQELEQRRGGLKMEDILTSNDLREWYLGI